MENATKDPISVHPVVGAALAENPDADMTQRVTLLTCGRVERGTRGPCLATLEMADGVRFGWNGVAAWVDVPGHLPGAMEIALVGCRADKVVEHRWLTTAGSLITGLERRAAKTRLHLDG